MRRLFSMYAEDVRRIPENSFRDLLHYRTHGRAALSEPALRDFHNIGIRDTVLASHRAPTRTAAPSPADVTTTIRHPVIGEPIPDPDARVQVLDHAK